MKQKLKMLFVSLIMAGCVIVIVGSYFSFAKAGIPYQDPTTEMTIRWTAYWLAGEACMRSGAIVFLVGLIGRLAFVFIK